MPADTPSKGSFNDLFGCATLYEDGDTSARLTDIRQVNALRDIPVRGNNLSLDPGFAGPPTDFHLGAGSPVIGRGTSVDAPPFDIDGDLRPGRAGWDMGFDQSL
jgi:hypothetical protein